MRHYPDNKWDHEELERLNAAPWMVEQLKLNPAYCGWGPHEDYMWNDGDGWSGRVIRSAWEDGKLGLDSLNEVVNFYFAIQRDSTKCETCEGHFYHPDAQWVSQSFYSHSSPFSMPTIRELQAEAVMARFGAPSLPDLHGRLNYPDKSTIAKYGDEFRAFCERMAVKGSWGHSDEYTEDEIAACKEAGRTNLGDTGFNSPDAITRGILVDKRLERFGIPALCPTCNGEGHVYTEPAAHLSLVLWVIHPRKGASRGWEIQRIEEHELPEVYAFLREARDRNAERFSRIPNAPTPPR